MLRADRPDRFGRSGTLALTSEITCGASKAEPIRVRSDMTVGQGFETITCSCLRHYRLNAPIVVERRDVEALHQVRVALRRLRSALAIFEPAVIGQEFERLRGELRWLVAEFGDARNLDVYLKRDLTLDQRFFVEGRREDAYDRVIAAMGSDRTRRLLIDFRKWAERGQWRGDPLAKGPLRRFVKTRIDRLWSKIAKSKRVARLSDKRRHRVRIRVKKLRYGLEFVDSLLVGSRHKKRFMKTLKDAQESLGSLHDIVTARSLVSLNSWLTAEELPARQERRLVRAADHAFAKLKKIGPYWTDSLHSKGLAWLT